MAKIKYPIGATWETQDKFGNFGKVYLNNRVNNIEFWYWQFTLKDGSGYLSDWTTSKASAVKECPVYSRFKRTL